MKKLFVGLSCLFAVGVSTAQMVTYFDNQGRPFMYSSKVGDQVTYFDNTGKPVAYTFAPSVSGPQVDLINTPSLVFPMVSPSLPGPQPLSLPDLPELPTLKGF